MLVGGVALVDGAASHLHRAKDDCVTQLLSAQVGGRAWGWKGGMEKKGRNTKEKNEINDSFLHFGAKRLSQ